MVLRRTALWSLLLRPFFSSLGSLFFLLFFFANFSNRCFLCYFGSSHGTGPPFSALTPWLDNQGPPSLARALPLLPLPATPSSCWRLSLGPPSRPSLGSAHAHAHAHARPPLATIARKLGEREKDGGVCVCVVGGWEWGGGCVCLLTLRNACPQKSKGRECSTQHLSCHSGLCHRVVDSPSKNRTAPSPLLLFARSSAHQDRKVTSINSKWLQYENGSSALCSCSLFELNELLLYVVIDSFLADNVGFSS